MSDTTLFSFPRIVALALASSLLLGTVPVAAGDNDRHWHDRDRAQQWRDGRDQRQDWRQKQRRVDARQDRRQQRQAYRQGYRDGRQVAPRGVNRAPVHAGTGWNQGGWNQGGWNQGGWNQGGWNQGDYGYPVQRYPVSSTGWQQGRDYWYDNGRYQCRRPDGTVGAVVGAAAGGTLGNILAGQGDKTLGSIIGGTLGAIVGKEIARGNARCR